MIFFTSDTHLSHNKEFLFGSRGFSNPEDMNREIVRRWNEVVKPEDEVYHLGDLVLSDTDAGIEFVKQLNGKIHLIRGNHDTDTKVERFKNECPNIVSIEWATMIKIHKIHFFLSHFPVCIGEIGNKNRNNLWCLCGHSHTKDKFIDIIDKKCYHVEMDCQNLTPVNAEKVIEDIKNFEHEWARMTM